MKKEQKYKELLERFLEEMNVFAETGFSDRLEKLEDEVEKELNKQ